MRRGGLSNNSAVAWRHRGDAIRRSVHFERWWEAHKFGRLTSIAVCSMIISIIILISRPMSLSGPDLSDNLQSSTHGVVFPLYHYTYFPNDSAEMGGREMWYGGRGAIRREIREESNLLLNILVPLQDKSEANVLGLLGCVVSKVLQGSEQVPLITDGLIGLGNCKGTLMEHWSKSNVISQNVLAVCLAKELERNTTISPATPRGFISLGNDFKEQFDRNSVWSKLADAESGVLCGYAAKLLSISFHDKALVFSSRFARQSIGISLLFDTGSDMTYFDAVFYDPLLRMLEDYATLRGYIRVEDNDKYVVNEQRVCWEPPRKTMTGGSPIQDFLPLVLAFEGIPSTTESAPLQYLVVHPENYLSWDAQVKKLCVNILQDYSVGTSVSNLGADMMREHLFVFDYEKQRVRWQSNSCAL